MPLPTRAGVLKNRAKRVRATSAARGYDARWQRARALYLAEHPLCARCERERKTTAAEVVDHIIPHRGNERLFWSVDNWQALCKQCHDAKTRAGM